MQVETIQKKYLASVTSRVIIRLKLTLASTVNASYKNRKKSKNEHEIATNILFLSNAYSYCVFMVFDALVLLLELLHLLRHARMLGWHKGERPQTFLKQADNAVNSFYLDLAP